MFLFRRLSAPPPPVLSAPRTHIHILLLQILDVKARYAEHYRSGMQDEATGHGLRGRMTGNSIAVQTVIFIPSVDGGLQR